MPNSRLLLLPCSDTKRPDPGRMPAISRYDGPLFQQVRRADLSDTSVCVLSARYGLIDGRTPIPTYDSRMTEARAQQLIAGGLHAEPAYMSDGVPAFRPYLVLRQTGYDHAAERYFERAYTDVCAVPWSNYGAVMRAYITEAQAEGLISANARITYTAGGLPSQRRQLGEWLRREFRLVA